MCIGMPMQVVEPDGSFAWCEADQQRERLDMMLVGDQPAGTWVLGFHGAARQVLSAKEAALARAGRQALAAVLGGDGRIDDFFADLVGREPELPAHLLPAASAKE
jgi:hydrogenase expression/formation protein HypC